MRRLPSGGVSFSDYRRYREEGLDLNTKLMRSMIEAEDIDRAAGMLGIKRAGGNLEFDSRMEADCTIDFILCDVKDGRGRSKVQAYLEDVGPATDFEREMLEMRIRAKTSLFRVGECRPHRRTVELSDQLHGSGDVTIYDKGLSASLEAGNSIFTRIYSGAGLCMTSGFLFGFAGEIAPMLIRRYSAMRAKPNRRGPASRFALFFRLNRKYGLPTALA